MSKTANRDKLYGRRWRAIRRRVLSDNPLCVMCSEVGRETLATEVDHIEKHDGDPERFYDVSNLQGLCASHHRRTKAKMERSGTVFGCDVNGYPIDPDHPWNAGNNNSG